MSSYRLIVRDKSQKAIFEILLTGSPQILGRKGSKSADIQIDDPLISQKHARIQGASTSPYLIIQDLESANGLKLEREKIKEAVFFPKVQVQIGSHFLEVETIDQTEGKSENESGSTESRPWHHEVKSLSDARRTEPTNTELKQPQAFRPAVRVEFLQGVHAGEVRVLTWGPVEFGQVGSDIPIFDEGIPDHLFELRRNQKNQMVIQTPHKESLRSDKIQEIEKKNWELVLEFEPVEFVFKSTVIHLSLDLEV